MTDINLVEIYRQRYETFRHLDKLRWQMLQILVAVGSAFALTIRATPGKTDWWLLMSIGFALGIISFVSFQINNGIRKNGIVLREVGKKIGDASIPDTSQKRLSSSHWVSVFIMIIALGFFTYGFVEYCKLFLEE